MRKHKKEKKGGFFRELLKIAGITALAGAVAVALSDEKTREKIVDGTNKVKDTLDKGVGRVKEEVGRIFENEELEFAGRMQQTGVEDYYTAEDAEKDEI
ncbi:MAG TPA: hypothetical protein GX726_01785 [Clostridiales bacterium]|jgi:uncharacterized protein YjbJ (UPF0337 family)|nr:hypothetical protein [Clostridiales bacterium]